MKKKMKIPPRIKIKNKIAYEVVFVDSFVNEETMGECRFDSRQIVIKSGMPHVTTIKTLIHEVLHAIDYERNLKIRHKDIYELEHALYYLLKTNDWGLI